jgi:hypothetical protein
MFCYVAPQEVEGLLYYTLVDECDEFVNLADKLQNAADKRQNSADKPLFCADKHEIFAEQSLIFCRSTKMISRKTVSTGTERNFEHIPPVPLLKIYNFWCVFKNEHWVQTKSFTKYPILRVGFLYKCLNTKSRKEWFLLLLKRGQSHWRLHYRKHC